MKKIVGVIQPFDFKQTFYIYEDGNKIDVKEIEIEELKKSILNLAKENDINEIDLIGSCKFSTGLKEQIEKEELLKYNSNNIKINII